MRPIILSAFLFIMTLAILPVQAFAAQETNFVITVKAKDAKFIGTAAGGAQVTIRDRRTGDIIFSGMAYGGTGDTDKIMADTIARDAVLVSDDSARLQFSLEFWEPTPVTITATVALGQLYGDISVAQDMVLLPGKDYTKDNGIMIELPGFAVNMLEPLPQQHFKLDPTTILPIRASVMKLCSCLLKAGTPWDPSRYQIEAHLYKDGLYITSVDMQPLEEPGQFSMNLKIPLAGTYRVIVTAFDPHTKEAGMDSTTIIVEE